MRQLFQEPPVPITGSRISIRERLPESTGIIKLYPYQQTRRGTPVHYDFGVWERFEFGWRVKGEIWAPEDLCCYWESWSR